MPTFDRILCPVDFSDTSTRAMHYAAAMAASFRATLTFQHVYVPLFAPVPGLPLPIERTPAGELDRIVAELRACSASAGLEYPADYVVDVGRPSDEIVARAARDRMDLVVLGTHGTGGFAHLVLGSVAEKVMRQVACPVLTVPPGVHAKSAGPLQRILCAVDFSEWSVAALEVAASVAEHSKGTLHVVHVVEWPWAETSASGYSDLPAAQADALLEFRRYLTDRASARLESAVQSARRVCPVRLQVSHGKAHIEIVRTAAADAVDLIVLGVHGRSPLDMTVFGSTTNQVVRHAACPVLTVRR